MRQIDQVATEDDGKKLIEKMEEKYKIKLPWKLVPITLMKANTPWSPVWDGSGAEHQLYTEHGVNPKHQFPDVVQAYKDLLNVSFHEGGGAIQEDD